MYKSILFPIDLEHTTEAGKALKLAIEEAQRSKAKLTIMTAAPGFGMPIVASYFEANAVSEALKEVARQLKQYVDDNVPDDIDSRAVVVEGHPGELILKQAQQDAIDLIVIPAQHSQIENIFLGSVAAQVVRHATCTVTVVK
ncbi:MAG: universal stress protein [Gammaproteobacteria bacterium]|nr:universal stress protein [Gammaproteobacteria bacterium]